MLKTIFVFVILVSSLSYASSKALRVIALSDFHGQLGPFIYETKGGQKLEVGGAAILSTYIAKLRQQAQAAGEEAVIIDAGDIFQGTFVSNSQEGKPVIDFYNHMGVDAAAIGNHEFDYGPEGKKTVAVDPGDDARGALKARMGQARFPILAVNILQNGKRPDWIRPSTLITKGDVKIGVIGATTQKTPETTLRQNVSDLEFVEPSKVIVEEAKLLRQQGADYVILTFHEGEVCPEFDAGGVPTKPDDFTGCTKMGLFPILDKIPAGTLDLVVAGHTHRIFTKNYAGVPVLQAGVKSTFVSWARFSDKKFKSFEFTAVCGQAVKKEGKLTCLKDAVIASTEPVVPAEFLGERVVADAEVAAMVKAEDDKVETILARPTGVTAAAEFTTSNMVESALANLMTDLSRLSIDETVDASVMNNGGFRAVIPRGPITYRQVYNVIPFDNFYAVLTITGEELHRAVLESVSPKHSAYTWTGIEAKLSEDCRSAEVAVNGQPLQLNGTYKVLTNEFVAGGGDGFANVGIQASSIKVMYNWGPMRDLLFATFAKLPSVIQPTDYFDANKSRVTVPAQCRQPAKAK